LGGEEAGLAGKRVGGGGHGEKYSMFARERPVRSLRKGTGK
jgi:hypothetical protein